MNKNKTITYVINIDTAREDFLDEKIDYILAVVFRLRGRRDYKMVFIDENGIIDSAINEIVENFIAKSLDPDDGSCAILHMNDEVTFCGCAKAFIQALLTFCYRDYCSHKANDDRYHAMEVVNIRNRGAYFKVSVPKELISDREYERMMALGPDYLSSVLSLPDTFKYVIPQYFFFLCENDAFNDPIVDNIRYYQIGLA